MPLNSRNSYVGFKKLTLGIVANFSDSNTFFRKPFITSPFFKYIHSCSYDINTILSSFKLHKVLNSNYKSSQSSIHSLNSLNYKTISSPSPHITTSCHTRPFDSKYHTQILHTKQINPCKITSQTCSQTKPFALNQFSFQRGLATRGTRPRIRPGGTPVKRKRNSNEVRSAPTDTPYIPTIQTDFTLKEVTLPERVSVRQLAILLGEKLPVIEAILSSFGESMANVDSILGVDTAELVALELGRVVRRSKSSNRNSIPNSSNPNSNSISNLTLAPRPPVVVVMGHVDHGKTSLLDALRSTSVAAREAGGITQHIGAFVVEMQSGAQITFLDTPGHAAFTNMRARGASVTDIVVLVVAADDGVMPQTMEAIHHARAASVPMVVAINKCDKPDADSASVRKQLINEGVELEDIGGDVQVVEVSATTKSGLDKLEDAILLQAEMMELKGRKEGEGEGVVIEARVDKGQGCLATVIVKEGEVRCGDYVVVGNQWGRLRSLKDDGGRTMLSAGPAIPAEICGLRGLPEAGDELMVVGSEERARRIAHARQLIAEKVRIQKMNEKTAKRTGQNTEKTKSEPSPSPSTSRGRTVQGKGAVKSVQNKGRKGEGEEGEEGKREGEEGEGEGEEEGEGEGSKSLNVSLVVKGDVKGTVEAVCNALDNLTSSQVSINVVHSGVGSISASDVAIADATNALCLIGFNVKLMGSSVDSLAKKSNIKIIQHRVIYHLLEDVGKLLVDLSPGTKEISVGGQAEILQIFEVKGRGREKVGACMIAGCRVVDGRLERQSTIRVVRSGETVFEGPCITLRREKLEVDTVGSGTECGVTLEGYQDFRIGDILHCLKETIRPPKLVSSRSGAMSIEV